MISFVAAAAVLMGTAFVPSIKWDDDSVTGVAGPHDPFSSYAPSMAVLSVRREIVLAGRRSLWLAAAQQQNGAARRVEEEVCRQLLRTMVGAEQRWHREHSWKVKDWPFKPRLGDPHESKMEATALARIGDPLNAEIHQILKRGVERRLARVAGFSKGGRVSDSHEARMAFYDSFSALSSTPLDFPRTDEGAWSLIAGAEHDDYQSDAKAIKQLLSPEERAEWERLVNEAREGIAAAARRQRADSTLRRGP